MIDGETVVYGLLGRPVARSLSPAMHNAAFATLGLNAVYLPFAPAAAQLQAAVAGLRALGVAGVNVTAPYKETILPHLDRLSAEARGCGAVNTIVCRQGILTGYNTDGAGLIRALREDVDFCPGQGTAVLFGAGGAARAVALALAGHGCPGLTLVNRSPAKAARLAALVSAATGVAAVGCAWEDPDCWGATAREASLLVNCTPAGMSDWPLSVAVPRPGQLACDLVYHPLWTPFLRRAAAGGARVKSGLGMLLYQGVLAFELWTGRQAPVEIMRGALRQGAGHWF